MGTVAGTPTGVQKDSLRERGYVVLPALVPRERHEAALRAINASLGRGLAPEDVPRMRAQSFCPELQKADVILDLFRATAASAVAASLVGKEGLERVTTAQIALSFPSDSDPGARPHPHLDGMYTPDNGVPAGSVLSFTMLAGIVLSDVETPDAGNLVVWPGSHQVLERYFRTQGPKSLLSGMPTVDLLRRLLPAEAEGPRPTEVGKPDRRLARMAGDQCALTGISRSAVPLRHQPSRCEQ